MVAELVRSTIAEEVIKDITAMVVDWIVTRTTIAINENPNEEMLTKEYVKLDASQAKLNEVEILFDTTSKRDDVKILMNEQCKIHDYAKNRYEEDLHSAARWQLCTSNSMTPEKEELDQRSKQQGPVKVETEKKTDEALQIQYIVQATDTLAVKQSEIPTIHAKGVNVIEYGTEGTLHALIRYVCGKARR